MRALVVIDVVAGIFELPVPLHEPERFLDRVAALVERARAAAIPIIYLQPISPEGTRFARGSSGRAIHFAIAPRDGDVVIEKAEPDGFQGTTLDALLRERGITELVLCGFASEACVDSTVRSAYSRGFSSVLAAGAHTTTANPVLTGAQIVAHHDFVLARFARVIPAEAIAL